MAGNHPSCLAQSSDREHVYKSLDKGVKILELVLEDVLLNSIITKMSVMNQNIPNVGCVYKTSKP